ncbi:MAG: DUF1549 domain-containing protein [Gemmataceae bacterium]
MRVEAAPPTRQTLSPRTRKLLAAYVAGQLSEPQRQTVKEFLSRSPSGRQLVRRLLAEKGNKPPRRKSRRWLSAGTCLVLLGLLATAALVGWGRLNHPSEDAMPAAAPAAKVIPKREKRSPKPTSAPETRAVPEAVNAAVAALPAEPTEEVAAPMVPTEVAAPAAQQVAPEVVAPQPAAPVGEELVAAKEVTPAPMVEVKQVAPPARQVQGGKRDPQAVADLLDQEIDRRLTAAQVPPSPRASDEEFVRRAYLHITGRIPDYDKVVAFLGSKDPQKRGKLIDELLASPHYGEHFGLIWELLLVEKEQRRPYIVLRHWFADNLNKGRGWDAIVTDLLTAEGVNKETPQAGFFLAHRDNGQPSPNRLAATTSRYFMGVSLGCAECHDHKLRNDVSMQDFWGMAAFFGQVRDAEYAKLNFISMMNGKAKTHEITEMPGPRGMIARKMPHPDPLPSGRIVIPDVSDPTRTHGEVGARFFHAEKATLSPKGPYRQVLAAWLTAPENRYFAPAAVNRLWAHFFARGLVNPLDQMFADNEPTHPELLKLLADEFRASGHDVKHLIRCLCLSETYQRTSRPVAGNEKDQELYSHMAVQVMGPVVLKNSLQVLIGLEPRSGQRGQNAATFEEYFDTTPEGNEDSTALNHGVPQYLLLMNATQFNNFGGASIYRKLTRATTAGSREQIIENLFLAVLARKPTPTELKRMADHVQNNGDDHADVFWALLNCAEFMMNH